MENISAARNLKQSSDSIEEAQATAEEAEKKNLDSINLRWILYLLAFAKNDTAGMAQQVAWFAGIPDTQGWTEGLEADTAAYSGHLEQARSLTHKAADSSVRNDNKESAAI